ncbi:NUDIX hydrolase [Bacillus sp. T33-2]|uniref:NUDIX hydrolase n=1 Tax=Bacillus sp. T33-2 TaxID=2054168 RepID=UPI000C76775F|nr:CoA pyrophosphatase [Bacillus sp. T33-2]PLR95194.1 coenzyme A pyrophosphatase [Bacillus sp. T33-2]
MSLESLLGSLKGRKPDILGHENFMKFSVLLPLIEKNNEVHVLFEVRAQGLRRQPGEICFPGGRIDAGDRNEQECAVRETSEELGIPKSKISNVVPLDYIVSAFGTVIYPFAGTIDEPDKIRPNVDEVGEIFTVPLDYFRKKAPDRYKINFQVHPEEGFPFDLIIGGENYNWQTRQMDEYFYRYGNKVIWGLTARVLSHFLELTDRG